MAGPKVSFNQRFHCTSEIYKSGRRSYKKGENTSHSSSCAVNTQSCAKWELSLRDYRQFQVCMLSSVKDEHQPHMHSHLIIPFAYNGTITMPCK